MTNYTVTARNFSEASENRIHSDAVARKFGFRGALVPGVAVYGHLTYPLVSQFGDEFARHWLEQGLDHLRLLKPAYHGDELSLDIESVADGQRVTCTNQTGELLATVHNQTVAPDNNAASDSTGQPDLLEGAARPQLDGDFKHPERILIEWESIQVGQPFAPWQYAISAGENQRYASEVNDPWPHYAEFAHPHLLCSLANTTLTNEYIMPIWIHVGTSTQRHSALRVGETINIHAVPMERWRHKGHEFIKLYISYWRGEQLTTELLHTAIYQVAS
ncbi:MAG: MaoC family dehydratase [Pseudomonadota bacterium]